MTATSIEWTDVSWNPTRGCSRVSAGCENCYAEGVARRFAGPGMPYEGLVRLTKDGKAKAQWSGEVRFIADKLAEPLTWKKPKRVFVNSMSDLFHEGVSFEQIAAIFGVMAAAPQHAFQALTKRPERARAFFEWASGRYDRSARAWKTTLFFEHARKILPSLPEEPRHGCKWPLANVWLGVSVEDQRSADERIPHLLACPAAVRWVSYEPALEAVDFRSDWLGRGRCPTHDFHSGFCVGPCPDIVSGLDWVVVGGESGPGARRFETQWARGVIEQCAQSGTACFVKQLGAWAEDEHGEEIQLKDRKGGDMQEWPADLRVRQWPGESR